ncbi:MAG: MJ1477/TM1410 family putative glycoside hydrolase [Luteolibacter sp.]
MKPAAFAAFFISCLSLCAETSPTSFAYVLQGDSFAKSKAAAVEKLAASEREWIVLDPTYGDDVKWSHADLDAIRKARPGRKIIAYISIGEAEDYRPYWKKTWLKNGKATAAAPSWLGEENPDWKGNFRVRYWQPGWQEIMLPVIADAMKQGFDGIYLDIIDGFETWEFDGKDWIDNRPNPETQQSYRRDMVDWVKAIAARAREENPDAIVIPQNGSQLLVHKDFVETISAIGVEDLFSIGNKKQSASHTKTVLNYLKPLTAAGKPALIIEYPTKPEKQAASQKSAETNHLTWLITDRNLTTLGTSGR